MNITPTNESPDEVNVPVEKVYECDICHDEGEIANGVDDSRICHCIAERKADERANEDNGE